MPSAYIRPAPAFQFYAADLLAKEEFRLMSLEERGLYISMLAQCWVSGTVPADIHDLAKLIGADVEQVEEALTERVKSFFTRADGGGHRLRNDELDKYRKAMEERRLERSKSGRRGAQRRRESVQSASSERENPQAEPMHIVQHPPEKKRTELSRGGRSSTSYLDKRTEEQRRADDEQLGAEIAEAFKKHVVSSS